MVQHTFEKISYSQKKLKKIDNSNYIIVENTHEPIISKEDFEKVQEILKERSKTQNQKNFDRYLFSGMMICGRCGHLLGVGNKKYKSGESLYTHCNHYMRKGKFSNCTPNRLNYKYLEQDLLNYLNEIGEEFIKHYDIRNLVEDTVYVFNKDITELENKMKIIDTKIQKKLDLISNLYNDKAEGIISVDVYKNLSERHEKELQSLKCEKEDIQEKLDIFANKSNEKEFTKCRENVEGFLKLKNPTRSVIKKLIEKIIIYDNGESKEVEVFFKFKELEYIANTIC